MSRSDMPITNFITVSDAQFEAPMGRYVAVNGVGTGAAVGVLAASPLLAWGGLAVAVYGAMSKNKKARNYGAVASVVGFAIPIVTVGVLAGRQA